MLSSRLLTVEPHEIEFYYEVGKEASCYVWLSNNTTQKVAFKVKSSNPHKYFGKPKVGLILPRQACVVVGSTNQIIAPVVVTKILKLREIIGEDLAVFVQMTAPRVNFEMQCQDTFVIQSLVAEPRATSNDINSNMFREAEPYVEEHELGVVYLDPSEPYQTEDYFNPYTREDIGRGSNVGHFGSWLVYGLLALFIVSFIQKTITLISSLVIVLLMKIVIKIVSDLVEDVTVKALVEVIVRFARFLFDYVKSRCISSTI